MRVIARRTLRDFVDALAGHKDQPAVRVALDAWFDEARKARWSSTDDVRRRYATTSIMSAERIVLNVKGCLLPSRRGRFREGHRLDQVDRQPQRLRPDRGDGG